MCRNTKSKLNACRMYGFIVFVHVAAVVVVVAEAAAESCNIWPVCSVSPSNLHILNRRPRGILNYNRAATVPYIRVPSFGSIATSQSMLGK
jgi:hypothetical protein